MWVLLWALLIIPNSFPSNTKFRRLDVFPSSGVRDFILLNKILLELFYSSLQLMMAYVNWISRLWMTVDGVRVAFINYVLISRNNNHYNSATNFHTLQIATAHINSLQSAVSSPVPCQRFLKEGILQLHKPRFPFTDSLACLSYSSLCYNWTDF